MGYIHTMEYCSTIKKNKILPFAAIWMNLKNIIFSEASQAEKENDITYMWSLKNNTNESVYKGEIDPWTWKRSLWLTKGERKREGRN